MKLIAGLISIALFAGCSQPNTFEDEIVSSSAMLIVAPGYSALDGCAEVGTVSIPQRHPSFVARHSGFAEEDFHRVLRVQTEPLKANLLVAAEGFDLVTAASSGEAFHGTAYVCP